MLKDILKLEGAKALNKKEQKEVTGGILTLPPFSDGCSCVFKGRFGFLELEILDPCNAQTRAECESRPSGRVVGGGF